MRESEKGKSSGILMAIVCIVVALVAASGFYLLQKRPTGHETPDEPVQPKKVHVAGKNQPVIDFRGLKENEDLKKEMDERKAAYGVEKGLDFIVNAGESLKIGNLTVPMQEILDKIRLKKGGIIENDLATRPDVAELQEEKTARIDELAKVESRYATLAERLKDPAASENRKTHEADVREHVDLAPIVTAFKGYKTALKELAAVRELLKEGDTESRAAARTTLGTLNRKIEKIERLLDIPKIPEKLSEAYGIYVVRSGDNIWNIHFRFLKEYFSHRQIMLAPMSDEPNVRGISSGIGKILKFSENMVYIYNLKERRLDVDLNLLQPLSKIVVFNMGEVLALLDPIDYRKVNSIKFDGDTLWIPAEQ
jgi:hypothetical protein